MYIVLNFFLLLQSSSGFEPQVLGCVQCRNAMLQRLAFETETTTRVKIPQTFTVFHIYFLLSFLGQLADIRATDKFANDRRENGDDLTATPFLFRKCCIAVSWSRYMAVAMRYGAPERVEATRSENNPEDGADKISSSTEKTEKDALIDTTQLTDNVNDNKDTELSRMVFDATSDTASSLAASSGAEDDLVENETTSALFAWWQKQKQAITDNKKKKLKSDPNEGILHLDKPLLLCQEIYDKFIGNHQTSVLSKEQAVGLLREDIEQHKRDGEMNGDNHPFLADQDWVLAQIEASRKLEEEQKVEGGKDAISLQDQEVSDSPKPHEKGHENDGPKENDRVTEQPTKVESEIDVNAGEAPPQSDTSSGVGNQRSELETPSQDVEGLQEEKKDEGSQEEGPPNSYWKWAFNPQQSQVKEPEGKANVDDDEDGICGYWKWENTWKTHQIKMHLAEASDLAMHVVLAIIANQVRYERNAIAMTV